MPFANKVYLMTECRDFCSPNISFRSIRSFHMLRNEPLASSYANSSYTSNRTARTALCEVPVCPETSAGGTTFNLSNSFFPNRSTILSLSSSNSNYSDYIHHHERMPINPASLQTASNPFAVRHSMRRCL